jgi:hypothetical protein
MSVSNKYKVEYKSQGYNRNINIKKLNLCLYINTLDSSRSFSQNYQRWWINYEVINNVLIEDTLVSMLKSKNNDDLRLAFEILSNRF